MTNHEDPPTPEVLCGEHGFSHRFCVIEREEFLPGFKCYCPDCLDGEYVDGVARATNTHGHGKTPLEAAEDYAEHCDVTLADLTFKEQHV